MALLGEYPDLRGKIVQLRKIGALPFYRGPPPEAPRPSGLPYDESKTIDMVKKIWKDVRLGRVFVMTSHVAGKEAPIIATPTTTVQKKLPGRTMSGDFWIISDLRLPNLFCDKDDYPPVKMTDIRQVAERAVAMKLKWPHVTIMCNKRDIDAAFKRVKVHPDMSVILCAEFSATKLGIEDDDASVLFLYLTLPFGWRASPAYFSQVGEGITLAHRAFISHDPKRDGADYFSSLLFAGEAIFIEPVTGKRREMVISCWGHICRRILGETAIIEEKVELEGEWQTSHILLGFEVGVDNLTIKLPTAKKVDAREYFQDSMLNPGNRIVTVHKVQELRGLANHWSYTNRFWHYLAPPMNGLLSFVDTTNTWVRCTNDQVRIAFWNLIAFIRSISEDDEQRNQLFSGSLEQNIPLPKRVGRKKGSGKVVWATGDAVISRIGAINWEKKEYIVEETIDFLPQVTPGHRRTTIGDSEQLAATSIVLAWSHPSLLLILGTDNRNVLAWTRKGYAKKGAALVLNQETSKWIDKSNAQVEGVYIRSGHNFSPEWMTGTTYEEIEELAQRHRFMRARLQPIWDEMMKHSNERPLKEVEIPESRIEQKQGKDIICVEWNGGGGCFTEAAGILVSLCNICNHVKNLAVNQFYERYECAPYVGCSIFLLGGSARTETEVNLFYNECKRLLPKQAVLIAPLGVDLSAHEWDYLQMVDSTVFGDVMGSIWQIAIWESVKGPRPRMFDGPETTQYAKTLGGRYRECGIMVAGDGRGVISHQAAQYSRGLEVIIADSKRQRRLSINSCIGMLSVKEVRMPEIKWPLVLGQEDNVREISIRGKCVVMGNKKRRKEILANDRAVIDTIWRSTPAHLRKELIWANR